MGADLTGTVVVIGHHYPSLLTARTLHEIGFEVAVITPPGGHALADFKELSSALMATGMRFVATDLQDRGTRTRLIRDELVPASAVLIGLSRPAVVKLGLQARDLHDAGVSGSLMYLHGTEQEEADTCGHDVGYQAMVGVSRLDPASFRIPWADTLLTASAVSATMTSILKSERGANHVVCEVTGTGALRWALTFAVQRDQNGDVALPPDDPGYGVYSTLDGQVALGMWYDDAAWGRFCHAMGLDELAGLTGRERNGHRATVESTLASFTTSRVTAALTAAAVPHARAGDLPTDPNGLPKSPFVFRTAT